MAASGSAGKATKRFLERRFLVAVQIIRCSCGSKQPPISTLIGVLLLTRKYPPDRAWKDDQTVGFCPYENVAATFLHLNADPQGSSWGWAPLRRKDNVGSVIVVREDGKALTPYQVEALSYYLPARAIADSLRIRSVLDW